MIKTVSCIALLAILCTCDPAPQAPVSVANQKPLLGIRYDPRPLDETTIRRTLDALTLGKGNYLVASPTYLDSSNLDQFDMLVRARGITTVFSDTIRCAATVADFNRQLLRGDTAVCLQLLNGASVNGIRAARIVNRILPLADLRPFDELLVAPNPTGARAATDGNDNYVIYIPARGEVTIRFPENGQFDRRVTVVGYLGTQRSEILRAPYDPIFTLSSQDERGGWMLIKRVI